MGVDFFIGAEGPLVPAHAAAALIVVDNGQYLLQLRDQKSGIFFPGHWGLFGGAIEPGESSEAALHRELGEELGLFAATAKYVTDFSFKFGRFGHIKRHYFEVAIQMSSLGGLKLQEGSKMCAFPISEILNLPRVVPYDSFAIWLHASGMLD
jgi:8-oxo-dGTP pyrophosphatase MutT (NUDIX family)